MAFWAVYSKSWFKKTYPDMIELYKCQIYEWYELLKSFRECRLWMEGVYVGMGTGF